LAGNNERIVFIIKKRPNILLLMVLLIGANIVAWLWAFTAFSNNTSLALSLIAWCYGLRHAVDADHIAAIDSATRKLMQQKKRALTTGPGFLWGTPPSWYWQALALL
jgi:high-affinity nickel-transport protein